MADLLAGWLAVALGPRLEVFLEPGGDGGGRPGGSGAHQVGHHGLQGGRGDGDRDVSADLEGLGGLQHLLYGGLVHVLGVALGVEAVQVLGPVL